MPQIVVAARVASSFGGVLMYLSDICVAALHSGMHVTLALNKHPNESPVLGMLQSEGVDFEFLSNCDNPIDQARAYDDLISRLQPDIFHFNDGCRIARQAMPRLRKLRDCSGQRVVTLHADIARLGRPGGRRSWALPFTEKARRRAEVKAFLDCFDIAISVSELFAQELPRTLGVDRSKIVGIPNGVDIEQFQSRVRTEARSRREIVIGASGGFFRYKRFDVMIEAVRMVAKHFPVKLRIAGSGNEESNLRAQVRRLGLENVVEFPGIVRDMVKFLDDVDIFLFASDAVETSSYSQLESMAMGLPSVCSRYGDLPIRVRDGIEGFIVPPGDANAMAERITRLVAEQDLRVSMGKAARQRVCESYSKERYLESTVNVFRMLMNGASNGVSMH